MTNSPGPELIGPGEIPPPGLDDVWLPADGQRVTVQTRAGELDLTGCVALRDLPDGRLLAVEPLLFGRARLCLGRPAVMAADAPWGGWDGYWEYPSGLAALVALATWEPGATEEPEGWDRHPETDRRRPGGDPGREEVRA